uniref:NTP pyrophosphohydrolase MazG-like domain-containing protein n=1 Tax=viral metagenome TaxID=1070528 RepID=A0A6C0F7F4_9ZZZZ|tara:strand:+ start:6125 stop:6409 length:285 start_codon:yes stop_codon:yes gene_type:complete
MASLNECKMTTIKICKAKGWNDVSTPHLWMFLIEEIGELASAIRRSTNQFTDNKKINIEGEIMDVLSYMFQLAERFDVDLDLEWNKYINKNKLR